MICQTFIQFGRYIFTDPPFGSNLMYSELNFIWEAWLRVITNNKSEAVINNTQRKGLDEYHDLMARCFGEMQRALKPGRWITVEFHNSKKMFGMQFKVPLHEPASLSPRLLFWTNSKALLSKSPAQVR